MALCPIFRFFDLAVWSTLPLCGLLSFCFLFFTRFMTLSVGNKEYGERYQLCQEKGFWKSSEIFNSKCQKTRNKYISLFPKQQRHTYRTFPAKSSRCLVWCTHRNDLVRFRRTLWFDLFRGVTVRYSITPSLSFNLLANPQIYFETPLWLSLIVFFIEVWKLTSFWRSCFTG